MTRPIFLSGIFSSIIKDRVDLSGARVPDGSLKLIAALSTELGSARDALMLTRTSIMNGKTSEEGIKELKHGMEEQTYRDYLAKLAPKERQVLNFIITEFINHKEAIPVRDVSKSLGLSPSRASQIITALEQYDIITTEMQRNHGSFRAVEPDKELVDKVAKKRDCSAIIEGDQRRR